jgi:hypothetical protein
MVRVTPYSEDDFSAAEAELQAASRQFTRADDHIRKSRSRLREAIIRFKRAGASVAQIEDIAPYRRGRITAILDTVGLVKKKAQGGAHDAPAVPPPAP